MLNVRVISLLISFFSAAMSLDSFAQGTQFELGVAKGTLLKTAIILDQHELECKKASGHKWENLVDSSFRSAWGHGSDFIIKNTASQTKMSIQEVKIYPLKEFNQTKLELGGCNSPKYKKYVNSMYQDYQSLLEMVLDTKYWSQS